MRERLTCTGCGAAMQYGGKKPAAAPLCLECRRKQPGYHGIYASPAVLRAIVCEICGKTAPATTNRDSGSQRQKTCGSRECRKEVERRRKRRWTTSSHVMDARTPSCRIWVKDCTECGKLYVARRETSMCCGDECRRKYRNRASCEGIMRRYYADPEFRDLVISKAQNRRASLLGQEGITSPAALIAYLMDRDHGRCGKCHKPIKAKTGPRRPSIGHIIPLARGGEHVLENVQAEHLDCNLRAGANDDGGQILLVG